MWGQLWRRLQALVEGGQLDAAVEQNPGAQAGRVAGGRRPGRRAGQRVAPRPSHSVHRPGARAIRRRRGCRSPGIRPDARCGACPRRRLVLRAPERARPTRRCQRRGDGFHTAPIRRAAAVHNTGSDRARAPAPFAGLPDEAAASYQQAGAPGTWSLPAFHILQGYVNGALVFATRSQIAAWSVRTSNEYIDE
jgi:hypothetical protein